MRSTISAASLLALAGGVAGAQTLWSNAAGGSYTLASNWSPADVPNSAAETARVNLAGMYEISLSGGVGVGGLELFNSDAILSIQSGSTLNILSGTLVNEGLIRINPTAGGADGVLAVNVDTTLMGSGVVRLSGITVDARLEALIGSTLTIASPQVVRGRGRLNGLITNESMIVGDAAGFDLEIGGTLTQTGAGMCLADGGRIGIVSGGRINGGLIGTANGGIWRTVSGSSIIDGVVNEGEGEVTGGTLMRLQSGGLVNNGVLTINPSAGGADGVFDVLSDAMLTGTGVLRLSAISTDAQLTSQPGVILTSASTIAGRGRISATIANDGDIVADVSGQVLEVNGTIMQSAGGECRGVDGGVLGLINLGLVSGGTLNSGNGGVWQARSGTSTIDNVRNVGAGEVASNATLELSSGGLINDGTIVVNPLALGGDGIFRAAQDTFIGGTGVLRLSAISVDAQLTSAPGMTLTNRDSHTIAGRGRISATVTNRGTIVADVALHPLELSGSITQSASGVCRGADAVFGLVNGGSIVGGSTNSSGTGMVQALSGTSSVDGITNLGQLDVASGATLLVGGGGIFNAGTLRINTTAGGGDAILKFIATAPLSGNGRINLNAFSVDGQLNTDPGATIMNGPNHTIAGRGRVNATIANDGTMDADVPGGVMEIAGSITQSANGVVRAGAGTWGLIAGGSLSGGQIDGTGAGSVEARAFTSSMRDIEIIGTFNIAGGASLNLGGIITNNGAIVINPTASGADAIVTATAPTQIVGAGTIEIRGFTADGQLTAAPGQTLTLGPDQVLKGRGRLAGEIVAQGAINPGLSPGNLQNVGALTFSPTSRLIIEVASLSSFDSITGSGTFALDGVVDVRQLDDFTPAIGDRIIILTGSAFSGLFDDIEAPDLGGAEWKIVYFPTKVELQVRCKADLSGSADPNDPNYGVPDGSNDASDFFYYLDLFVTQDPRADLTGSSDPNDPSYGIKDGTIDASDFFFFLDVFTSACG